MSRFLGNKRIENKIEDGNHFILEFKDGSKDRLSKKMFEASATRESIDPTALYDRQLAPVAKEILQTLLDWDVQLEQLSYLINILQTSLQHNSDKANEILWKKNKRERRMSDVDVILKSVQTNGEATE